MTIRSENEITNIYELQEASWSGAIDTINDIIDAEKEDEFLELLEEYFPEGAEDTELNDFIWFERGTIYDALGLDENGKLIEEEE